MNPVQVVQVVLIVEGAVLAVALGAIFWHALAMRAGAAGRAPRLARGRAILYDALERGSADVADVEVLRSFPRSTLVRLFAELLPSLVGDDRARAAEIAEQIGLLAFARRRAGSALWWRRLNAARLLTLFAQSDDVMLTLAADSHPLVRAQAAEAFGGGASDRELDVLIGLVRDPHPFVRFMARDSLVRLGRRAQQAVAARLAGSDPLVLLPLLSVAAASPSHDFVAPATRLVTHADPRVRAGAADTLRAVGGSDAAALLATLLDDPDTDVRLHAVDGLAALGFWPASPAIARLLDDPQWQLRYRAAVALQNLGGPGELLLRRAAAQQSDGAAVARRVLDAGAQLRAEVAR